MTLRRLLLSLLPSAMLLPLAGCTADTDSRDTSGDRIAAVVSIPPQQWLLEQLGGDRVEAGCMLESGSDPENYEPLMRSLIDVERSQVYFTLGGLPFEEALVERTAANNPSLVIVDTSAGIEKLADSCHGHHHHHHGEGHEDEEHHDEGFDPHIWTTPANCRIMAGNMLRTLCCLDTAGTDIYRRRFARLDSLLTTTDDSIRAILADCRDRTFMVWHPSLGYFAATYGLRQLSVQQEGKEVTPRQLADAVDLARKARPVAVFYDIAQQGNETALLSGDMQASACPLRLMDRGFLHQLVVAAQAIRQNQRE